MKPFDIYRAKFRWRGCDDMRPWLLARPSPSGWLCFAISGQDYSGGPFEVLSTDPDISATGLTKTSYIYDAESFHDLPLRSFAKRLGELQGDLLRRFREASGV